MALDALAGLITAVFELKAVQAVTNAINANLPKDGPLGTIRPSSAQLYARPRRYYSPTPGTHPLPRPVVHPMPTFAASTDRYDRGGSNGCATPVEPSNPWTMEGPTPSGKPGPIDPPWKHLPPVAHPVDIVKVNLVRPKVDLVTKGMLMDFYA